MSAATTALIIQVGIFAIAALGLDFIVGYSKIFSVNHGLIFAIGAFSYVFVTTQLHSSNLLLAWLIALAVASAVSVLIGLASQRVKGDGFVIVSFGAQVIGIQAIYNVPDISGGSSGAFGLPVPTLLGWTPGTLHQYLVLVLVVVLGCFAGTFLIVRSPWGRVLRAVGQDETAASAGGFDARKIKLVAFVLAGAYAAVAGALFAGYLGTAQINDYGLNLSTALLAIVVLGGAGRLLGGLLGAVVYVGVPYLLRQTDLPSGQASQIESGLFGLALVLVVLFAPAGLSGGLSILISKLRRSPKAPPPPRAKGTERGSGMEHREVTLP